MVVQCLCAPATNHIFTVGETYRVNKDGFILGDRGPLAYRFDTASMTVSFADGAVYFESDKEGE